MRSLIHLNDLLARVLAGDEPHGGAANAQRSSHRLQHCLIGGAPNGPGRHPHVQHVVLPLDFAARCARVSA